MTICIITKKIKIGNAVADYKSDIFRETAEERFESLEKTEQF
jgi:hypothetical protein